MDTVIVKLGTSSVWHEGTMERTMDACAEIMASGMGIIIVSSGAIEGGVRYLEQNGKCPPGWARRTYPKPTLAGFGSLPLLARWHVVMARYKRTPVPLWLTHKNLTSSDERRSIQNLIQSVVCGKHGIIVANENDAVSNEEINRWERGLGENDRLTEVLVRVLKDVTDVKVRCVYFGTAVGGYYAPYPVTPATKLVHTVPVSDVPSEHLLQFLDPALSAHDGIQNDMIPKLCAATMCVRHGVEHVGIGKAYRVADFVLRPSTFQGTRVVRAT